MNTIVDIKHNIINHGIIHYLLGVNIMNKEHFNTIKNNNTVIINLCQNFYSTLSLNVRVQISV